MRPSVTRVGVRTRRVAHTRRRHRRRSRRSHSATIRLTRATASAPIPPRCFCQHVEPTPCARRCVIAEPQQYILSENDLKETASAEQCVQHATQLAPEAVAARLRPGAEAPRSRQAWPAARRPTCSCAASSGATRQPSRRIASARGPWPRSLSAEPLGARKRLLRASHTNENSDHDIRTDRVHRRPTNVSSCTCRRGA